MLISHITIQIMKLSRQSPMHIQDVAGKSAVCFLHHEGFCQHHECGLLYLECALAFAFHIHDRRGKFE